MPTNMKPCKKFDEKAQTDKFTVFARGGPRKSEIIRQKLGAQLKFGCQQQQPYHTKLQLGISRLPEGLEGM